MPKQQRFLGGTLSGTVCRQIPAADLDHPDSRVALNFGGDRVYFGPSNSQEQSKAPAEYEPSSDDLALGAQSNPHEVDVDHPDSILAINYNDGGLSYFD